MGRDRWQELCKKYEQDDGLPTRSVGPWTADKLYFWHSYIAITTSAMVDKPSWPAGLTYVDLFGGPGICELEETCQRIPGSVLIAANATKRFRHILACERDHGCAKALRERLAGTPSRDLAIVFEQDCNCAVHEMVQRIPPRSLTLAFIDPENLRVDFSTVRALADRGRVDLLILFADGMDIVRNVDRYEQQTNSVLDRMLGPDSAWREQWAKLENRSAENICKLFADEYRSQLKKHLGYQVFGEKVMYRKQIPLYRLIFASKNEKGLEFWDKVTRKERRGQTSFL